MDEAEGRGAPSWMPGPPLRGDLAAAKDVEVDDDETSFTAEHVALVVPPVDQEASRHLKRLVAGWGMLADFAFADLLLYVAMPSPDGGPERYLVVTQVRPNTGQPLFAEAVVGRTKSPSPGVARGGGLDGRGRDRQPLAG